MEKEFRSIETIFDIQKRNVSGYAILFNVESLDLGGFTEIIDKNALDGIIEKSDVIAYFDHDQKKVMARSTNGTGTLDLSIDQIGLKYSFDAPETSDGNDLLYHLNSGNLRNSSFGFTVNKKDVKGEWIGKKYIRTINKVDTLFDISPVFKPAYSDTTAILRSISEIIPEIIPEIIVVPEVIPEIIVPEIIVPEVFENINIKYNDINYTIPLISEVKLAIEKTDNEIKMNKYFLELENVAESLKK